MASRIVTLPGDGIGPEIMAAALRVLDALGDFEYDEQLLGGASIDAHGTALTEDTLAACRAADAVLLAAVGGPRWDTTHPGAPRPEQGLLGLRKGLGLFANLRPVRPSPSLLHASPLKSERIQGTDLLVVRELTGGIYFGDSGRDGDTAHDDCVYSVGEIERIARVAFKAARTKVTSVDKANVLETSRLWREVVTRVHDEEFSAVPLEHLLVDNAAMQLVSQPSSFDVIVTENLFGDILSDEAAMLTGSLGMLPSASIGGGPHGGPSGPSGKNGPGLFEPVHGSAPDIAGTGKANPLAMFGSVVLMLRHGLGSDDAAAALDSAIDRALQDGIRTADLGGTHTTEDATQAVLAHL
ncbi:MAG: 3-isopropylmalate dehydrogenase [Thermoleophilaceae bacterium]|nr:3-isopropylmalate dehydrogenase [Thermoleophilaceae bacterium]